MQWELFNGLDCLTNEYGLLGLIHSLTLHKPMTHIILCVMSSHNPIRIYMGIYINTLYRLFCLLKLVGKGLKGASVNSLAEPLLLIFTRCTQFHPVTTSTDQPCSLYRKQSLDHECWKEATCSVPMNTAPQECEALWLPIVAPYYNILYTLLENFRGIIFCGWTHTYATSKFKLAR